MILWGIVDSYVKENIFTICTTLFTAYKLFQNIEFYIIYYVRN